MGSAEVAGLLQQFESDKALPSRGETAFDTGDWPSLARFHFVLHSESIESGDVRRAHEHLNQVTRT
jgi:hypothetical protein